MSVSVTSFGTTEPTAIGADAARGRAGDAATSRGTSVTMAASTSLLRMSDDLR